MTQRFTINAEVSMAAEQRTMVGFRSQIAAYADRNPIDAKVLVGRTFRVVSVGKDEVALVEVEALTTEDLPSCDRGSGYGSCYRG